LGIQAAAEIAVGGFNYKTRPGATAEIKPSQLDDLVSNTLVKEIVPAGAGVPIVKRFPPVPDELNCLACNLQIS